VAAAAGVAKQAEERMAGAIPTADLAVRAVGIGAALRISALAGFVTDCAPRAVAILAAFGAGAGLAVDAAHQPLAALELRIGAGLGLGNAQVSALAQRDAVIGAAFLALAAFAMAGTAITEFAGPAIVIVFAFRRWGTANTNAIDAVVGAARAIARAAGPFQSTVIAREAPLGAKIRAGWLLDIDAIDPIETHLEHALAIDAGFAVVAVLIAAAFRHGALAIDALATAALVAGAAATRPLAVTVVAGRAILFTRGNALVADACVTWVAVGIGAAGQIDALVTLALLTGSTIAVSTAGQIDALIAFTFLTGTAVAIGATGQIDALVALADLTGTAVTVGTARQIDAQAAFTRLTGATIAIRATLGTALTAHPGVHAEGLPRRTPTTVAVTGRWVDIIAAQSGAAVVAHPWVILADLAGRPALLRPNALGPERGHAS